MSVYGEYPPPLGVTRSPALSRADAEYLLLLTQTDWVTKHEAKNREPNLRMRDGLSDELRRIEAVQNKLRGML